LKKDNPVKKIVSKLIQVGVVVKDGKKSAKDLEGFGLGPFQPGVPPPDADGMFYGDKPATNIPPVLLTRFGDVELELLEPSEKESLWKDFLNRKNEGIQHIEMEVEDIDAALASLNAQGAKTLVTGNARGKIQAAYVDLGISNILIELAKARKGSK
jgi:methylmalonyl-CoA/ethylmalonyl-CoA epimerase